MEKEFVKFEVQAETNEAKTAFVQFVDNYKETITGYLNTVMKAAGTPVDSGIEVKDGMIRVFQLAPDKGWVIGETTTGDLPVAIMKYEDVTVGLKYLLPHEEKMALYLKTESGDADVRLGLFKTLNDSIKEFHSESVKTVLKQYHSHQQKLEAEKIATEKRLATIAKREEKLKNKKK
jgi:hypothetical protein